ncbi:hypothetical protein EUTSA_v10023670mg [Eutrema salsugineum]|uniref:Uncharacterized protein n=1 Tax=Eutrema salsugineum TaxID=72664 RepID=V4JUX4_EUTSA|nr:uncharacterized protein LOC18009824 [Eutrema salsugineum]ESQ29175.1 hypothetical protein EUTSA_v10023670mg [Eutrema salsugineum]
MAQPFTNLLKFDTDFWNSVPTKVPFKPAHVIWDWDNAPLPLGYDIELLLPKIQTALTIYDTNLKIKTFAACGSFFGLGVNELPEDQSFFREERLSYLDANNPPYRSFRTPVRVRKCAKCGHESTNLTWMNDAQLEEHYKKNHQDDYSRVMDVGDAILAREIKYLNMTDPPPGVVLLISEDKDFAKSLKFAVEQGYKVLLATPHEAEDLEPFAKAVWTSSKLFEGGVDGPFKSR